MDWATGAALLVSLPADRQVGTGTRSGSSCTREETDYCRRLREAGYAIRYLPDAVVTHKGAGSGTGPALVALTAVNKLRYYRKYHGRASSAAFRLVLIGTQVLRAEPAGAAAGPCRAAVRAPLGGAARPEPLRRGGGVGRTMKILVYPHAMELGGSQLNAIELAAAVRDLGHQVAIIGEDGALARRVEELGLERVAIPPSGGARRRPWRSSCAA